MEAIDVMITSKKRAIALAAPTGFGKSAAYVAAAILSKLPTCIVTSSRGLQDQLLEDFSSIGLVDIRGRRNYPCDMREDMTCEEGYASRCPYKGTVGCPSSQAEMRAATSPLVVTNYDKWTAAKKFGQGMNHFQQVIFDEGHEAPEALARAMQVTLHHKEIEQNLKLSFPTKDNDEFWVWKPWAAHARMVAEVAQQAAQARLQEPNVKSAWVRHYTHMRNLTRRLATLALANDREWVVEEVKEGFQFDPVRPGRYSESTLLLRTPKIIVVSATLRPKTMFMMGIGKDNFEFKEFDSDFDRKRCPIYYVPTMRVDKRNPDLRMLYMRLDQIAAKRRDRKGIVQTVSYQRQEDVRTASRFYDSMFLNPKGEAPTEMIEQYRNAGPGSILVSPSVGTGYDFPKEQCEWNFLCKIPFEPPSVILRAREAEDPEYRAYKAMQKMVQIFGRGMRSKEDRCENFIGDDHVSWFLPRFGHLAPRSFHGFYKTVTVVPPAPEKL